MQDLRAVLLGTRIDWPIEAGGAGSEGPGCDVVLQELLIDDIDDGGGESFDVFGTCYQGFYVSWRV